MRLAHLPCLLLLAAPSAFSLQCRNWSDVLVQSFMLKRSDPTALKQLFAASADEYKRERVSREVEGVASYKARSIPGHPALPQLKAMLRECYRIGAELYGVRFDAEETYVVPDMEINAFATGSHVFVHDGLLLYFTEPLTYLARANLIPRNLSRDDYARLAYRFDWKNDYDSIYFVVAHETAHNLMAHHDESIFASIQSQVQRYADDAKSYRNAIANGKPGTGFKHYLGQSLMSFLSGPERSRKQVAQEEEADAVASDILRRVGRDPRAGLVWQERMDRLYGTERQTSWTSILNSVFCSTHPDSMQRRSALQRNISCLNYGGKLCEQHIAFPVPNQLEHMNNQFSQIERFLEDTIAIADGRKAPEPGERPIEIKPNPKDARLLIDGAAISQLKTTIATGHHVLTATREGYRPIQIRFAVFPDTKSTLKFKLKKCEKNEPCEAAVPVEQTTETETPEEPDSDDDKRPHLRRKS
jgi:Zn-dependent protease with chaperone function